jgi:TolB protein
MNRLHKSFVYGLLMLSLISGGCANRTETSAGNTPAPAQTTASTPISTTNTPTAFASCSRIAFTLFKDDSGQIYTACADGSELTALTHNSSGHTQPAWSPDGRQIAYAADVNGANQIFIMQADGSGTKQLTSDLANDLPVWLPDGKSMAFRTTDEKGLWWWRTLDLTSGQISQYSQPLYDFYSSKPAWSADGRYLATMSLLEQTARNDGAAQLHLKDLQNGTETALTHDTWTYLSPVFSPDSRHIAVFSDRDGTYNTYALYVMALDDSGMKRVSQPIYDESAAASWSPDGKEIIVSSDNSPKKTLIYNVETGASRSFLDDMYVSRPAWGK